MFANFHIKAIIFQCFFGIIWCLKYNNVRWIYCRWRKISFKYMNKLYNVKKNYSENNYSCINWIIRLHFHWKCGIWQIGLAIVSTVTGGRKTDFDLWHSFSLFSRVWCSFLCPFSPAAGVPIRTSLFLLTACLSQIDHSLRVWLLCY